MSSPSPTLSEMCVAKPLALGIEWGGGEVLKLRLMWSEGQEPSLATPAGEALQAALGRYVAGKEPDWPELPLSWRGVSDFSRQVLNALTRVPLGQKVSYGWLAARVGRPKAARAVGRVMAANPFPLLIPCHRVVGSSGALVGFGPGVDMKKYLLQREGA
ncbi:methylated-DNA/protein-cysteine methyltransferase [Solidesulfovibrio fructosivorans JJ]]|uniref:methylated-DNA--[protein]-cysteine S-methyltransferase n=1 Tax=Solidesulfovibrio fructosivorans JJ] TaxID=596151 RepID=E1JRT3_SOLFR|nr:methylated-DNA--[protein]-cysteine S-methyltransferase [Solidesulfovibrio fructosivorans]EFL52702.1 methylated-DNA/protein-cysteine methyltransferase [Solidesulfovibrio fructosivorans JJ]]